MGKAIEDIVAWADRSGQIRSPITQDEYERWRKDFSFLALKGQRYGQSFCNSFGITDNHLYYAVDNNTWADEYIRRHYIERT